jgi:hypothetical protein
MEIFAEIFTKFIGVVSQVKGYLGANPSVLICIIEGFVLAIGAIWGFFIKGRKEGDKIDLENEKAKLEIERIKALNDLEIAKAKEELKVTGSPEYQKELAKLLIEEKKADISVKKSEAALKQAEAEFKKAETKKLKNRRN